MTLIPFNSGHRSSGVSRTGSHSIPHRVSMPSTENPVPSKPAEKSMHPSLVKIALGSAAVGAVAVPLADYGMSFLLNYDPSTVRLALEAAVGAAAGGVVGRYAIQEAIKFYDRATSHDRLHESE